MSLDQPHVRLGSGDDAKEAKSNLDVGERQ